MIKSVLISIFLLITCASSERKDKFIYENLPKKYIISSSYLKNKKNEIKFEIKKAFDITKMLPDGYVKDGTQDYTKYIQEALDKHNLIVFPNFPVLINKAGLSLKSNSKVIFNEKSILIMDKNSEQNYEILRLDKIENVRVYFPVLIGDRNVHQGTKGEWGMGISITGSSNITILNPKVTNCWGDGMYVGYSDKISNNIKILYPVIDNNRRNGISITSVDNLVIESPVISNTNGTLPSCGIDIEPNKNRDEINNISINNAITFNNHEYGIAIHLENFKGEQEKNVNIKIQSQIDDKSISGFIFYGIDPDNLKVKKSLKGKIEVINPRWENNKEPVSTLKTDQYSSDLILERKNK